MSGHNGAAIRVFLIDDHRSMLWGLERLVKSARPGMELVGSATNCTDAFKRLDEASPDVILLDILLGNESGLDAIAQLIARSKAKILVLTGLRDKAVHDKAVMAGARGVVEKEAPAEMILAAIEKVHDGQLWLSGDAVGRIFIELSRKAAAAQATDPEQLKISALTDREREIVVAIATYEGATVRTIAEALHISEHTLHNHLTSIYDKLGVANRLGLFAYAYQHGLIKRPS